MKYKVVIKDQIWYRNAMCNATNKHYDIYLKKIQQGCRAGMLPKSELSHAAIINRCWNTEYLNNNIRFSERSIIEPDLDTHHCEVTFENEQEYIAFILRWS